MSDVPKNQRCDGLLIDRRGGGQCCEKAKFCIDSTTAVYYSCAQHLAQVVRDRLVKDAKVTVTI